MTARRAPEVDQGRPSLAVAAAFLGLGAALAGLMTAYWLVALKPRLRGEAQQQAQILADSQASSIATALSSGTGTARQIAVEATLRRLLVLRHSDGDAPHFLGVELTVDAESLGADPGQLDLTLGEPAGGFPADVLILHPDTSELLANARFRVSDAVFRQLSDDVRRGLIGVTAAGEGLLALLWGIVAILQSRLQRQTRRRLLAERALSEQERRYERLVGELSTYFVYGKDASGRLRSVSASVEKVLGFPPGEFQERFSARLGGSVDGEGERSFEVQVPDRGGETHFLEASEVPVLDGEGRAVGWDGIVRDVTARKRFERELELAREQAEAANEAKSQFLANMSHEIRTPLNAILGMAALGLKVTTDPRERAYLEKIRASGRLLVEIIEDILDLSRIEAGRLEIHEQELDLDGLLADLADVIGVRAALKGIEVVFDVAPDTPRSLSGDAVRLKQVLLNLMNNAVKFTDAGEIAVRIAPEVVEPSSSTIRFAVSDTGIGIPSDRLPELFEPFTQVDGSSTRRYGGVGLGLAISRRLVALMGGALGAESEPGRGSTFSFAVRFELPAGPRGPRLLEEGLRGLPVLLADDHPGARGALATMLATLSCRVTSVSTGEEAVAAAARAIAHREPFRLAVLDWKMPGLDGLEVAARLAEGELGPAPAVILVTAHDTSSIAGRAQAAGVRVVLHKPVSPSTLHDAIVDSLAPGRHQRAPATPGGTRFEPGQEVLLVEDHPINRELARELLSQSGLSITEANDGLEAVAAVEARRFDAVLMDVQMPGMDGLEAVRAIRSLEGRRDLPVIAMTAHAMMGDRERFLAAGMSDYVAKPIEEAELTRVLARWLRTSRAPTGPAPDGAGLAVPGVDLEGGLRRAAGNADLYRRLLVAFVEELEGALPELRGELEVGDADGARRRLHRVKGAAGTLGADRVASAAAELETTLERDPGAWSLEALQEAVGEVSSGLPAVLRASQRGDAAPGSDAEPDATSAGRGVEILDRLLDHLAKNDLAAGHVYHELQGALGRFLPGTLTELGAQLERLEFEAAALVAGKLRDRLASVAEADA
jgi:PAS domain S-box-containing protein